MTLIFKNLSAIQETQVNIWVRKIPWRSEWLPTPVFLPGESHERRRLVGLQSMEESQRVGHDWVTNTFTFILVTGQVKGICVCVCVCVFPVYLSCWGGGCNLVPRFLHMNIHGILQSEGVAKNIIFSKSLIWLTGDAPVAHTFPRVCAQEDLTAGVGLWPFSEPGRILELTPLNFSL